MGGSGGGGLGSRSGGLPRPGGTGGGSGADDCALRFDVDLESVDPAVLAVVPVGTDCAVTLHRQGGYDVAVVVAPAGGIVGSLSGFRGLATLLRCIRDGNVYVAAVTARTANTCHVLVTRAAAP
ncbi:hypothetical protein [Antarcticirhabdus aurantiaca]|uniref:Uncharacterized protein n=1 Tax=Antarcticirhabdus aurantiaca TaxID=2606717 RepID=A0ACD4NRI2_9HYPH|nr:hypothetical protein [Antarcticirhabdus aurantiaca]WAJ29541.1 hypothetical protein OXU80_04715 [Jeongeuplla avenae]